MSHYKKSVHIFSPYPFVDPHSRLAFMQPFLTGVAI